MRVDLMGWITRSCYVSSSYTSLICLVNEHSVLLDQIVLCCQLSAADPSRSPLHDCETGYVTVLPRPDYCQPSGSHWSSICSSNHSQALFCDIYPTVTPSLAVAIGLAT